jgi:ABC-type nitrate/sulfonate/bicarbonate transport system substrate-binding protein
VGPATHVTVAFPARVVTMTGFYIATEQGYTREEGLDAEMVQMNGTLSAQGIVARQVDFGMSAGALLAAALRGAPLKNVFVQMDKPLFYLFTQPDVTTIGDLAGKPFGVNAIGDSTHLAALAALQAGGVTPERVTFIANITGPQTVAALQAGAVSGVVTAPPLDLMAERMGYRNHGFLGDYLDYLTSGLATHEDTIRERPALVKAIVRAELKAHRYMQQNREGTLAHMSRFQEIGRDEAAETYDRHMRHLTRDGTSTPERLENILRDQRHELGIERAIPVEEAFDLTFARQANDELDRASWRP